MQVISCTYKKYENFLFEKFYVFQVDKSKSSSNVYPEDEEVQKCVIRIIHRSLICLGDLSRYQLDLDPNWDPQIAIRYYKIAVTLDSKYGMPYNQLGTVAHNKNYGLDAVYNYMRRLVEK